jgi:hypothetical protein
LQIKAIKAMKTIKQFATLFCALTLSVFSANSQIIVPGSEYLLDQLRLYDTFDGNESVPYSNIVGDPYLYKDFYPGKLVLTTGENIGLDMRYDIYADQIHFRDKKNTVFALLQPEKISMITIDTVKFVYDRISKSGNLPTDKSAYFIVRADGKCKLLVKKNLRIQDAEPPKPYMDAKPAKFIHTEDTYYLKLQGKNPVRISSKKDILNVLSDKKNELSNFFKSEKPVTKSVDDLVKIIKYYNGL